MKKFLSSGLAIGAMISLVGCGGGSSSSTTPSTITGQFIDGPVAGLNYTCTTAPAGVTDGMGYYTCNTGDTVTFSVGDYVIGSTQASEGIVTPSDIATEQNEVSNIAVLLQSLDTDTTDGDIITLDGNFTSTVDLNSTPEDFETEIIAEDNGITIDTIVDADTAITNMQESELRTLLGGMTFYEAGTDEEVFVYLDSWVISDFIDNEANSTWTELMHATADTADATGEDTLTISTNGQLVTTIELVGEDGIHTLAYNKDESTDTYLAFDVTNSPDGPFQLKLYFELADAEAYYDSLLPSELELLTVGKTHYFITSEGVTGQRSYATDGTFTGNITLADDQVLGTSGIYTIENDVLTINRRSPNTMEIVLTYTGEEAGGLGFTGSIDGGDEFQTVSFYTEAELDAYLASLSSTLLREMLAGNTWASADTTITFNADVTSIEFADGGTDTVSLDGMTLTHSEGMEVITIVNETTLSFSYNGVEAGETFTLVPAPDAADVALLREMLAGNTWESIDTTLTFNAEVTSVSILDAGSSVPFSDTVSLDGMTLTHSEGTEVITIVDETTLRFNTETFILVPLP